MSGYQALYRKYRPQTFKELAGQDPIAETLRNEVREGRLAHAYLFTGPRGTGKTTSARLLAKALNCQHGPTPDPCAEEDAASGVSECPQCKAIRTGSHLDVIEIDAASNRGIDDIRSLQERVQLAPVFGRYKVFIIDEVHMLTDPAWNALLKTLEEPPPNCVFVMATTEVHKVLATVLSRCQRFDFQRISRSALVERLRFVAAREGLEIEDEALDILARRADGGLRDALSLLDQVSATTRHISAAAVYDALGMLPADQVLELGQRIADRDAVGALQVAYDLLAAGHDHRTILRELLAWARNLLLLQLAPERAEALDIPQAQVARLREHAGAFTQVDVLQAMEVLRETDHALRGSNQMTIWLEVGLLRLCDRTSVPSLVELASRVADLEARLAGGASTIAPAAAPAPRPPGDGARASEAAARPGAPATPPPVPSPVPLSPAASSVPASPAPAAPVPPARPAAAASAVPLAAADPGVPAVPPGPPREGAGAGTLDRDVYAEILARLEQVGPKSKSEVFKQMVVAATLKSDGTLLLRAKGSSFQSADRRAFVQDNARALFGPGVRLEVIEERPGTRGGARPHATAPTAVSPPGAVRSAAATPPTAAPSAASAASPAAAPASSAVPAAPPAGGMAGAHPAPPDTPGSASPPPTRSPAPTPAPAGENGQSVPPSGSGAGAPTHLNGQSTPSSGSGSEAPPDGNGPFVPPSGGGKAAPPHGNGHSAAPPAAPSRVYDSGDPVALAAEIFLGKIVDNR